MFDNQFMQLALQQAQKAFEENEVPVGCVIVHRKTKEIIASTHNLVENNNNPTHHAEILAIDAACKKLNSKNLSECDLYVTLEPCTMCASAISHSRIKNLYFGANDEKQGAVESGVNFFSSNSCFHKPEIYSNIMTEESKELLKKFFKTLR